MKEPTCTSIDGTDHNGHAIETCYECGTEWPCTTWRRWIKSKDYRIAELEATVKRLTYKSERHDARQRDLEQTVRADSNILRNGIVLAMADLATDGRMGDLTLDWQRDELDVNGFASASRCLPLPAELTVTYADVDGRTWTNGVVTVVRRGSA